MEKTQVERLKELKAKVDEERKSIEEARDEWDAAEKEIDNTDFKKMAKELIEEASFKGEDLQVMIVADLMELVFNSLIQSMRVAAIEGRPRRMNKYCEKLIGR